MGGGGDVLSLVVCNIEAINGTRSNSMFCFAFLNNLV